jgi:hypothetical protein
VWFSGLALVGVWKFSRLNAHMPAQVLSWQVRELSSSRFALEADYCFEVEGIVYQGKTLFKKSQFLNRFSAENYIKTFRVKQWEVWYKKRDPSLSSLEKRFPQKECLQALLTIGVFIYFFFARSMLSRLLN